MSYSENNLTGLPQDSVLRKASSHALRLCSARGCSSYVTPKNHMPNRSFSNVIQSDKAEAISTRASAVVKQSICSSLLRHARERTGCLLSAPGLTALAPQGHLPSAALWRTVPPCRARRSNISCLTTQPQQLRLRPLPLS